MEGSYVGPHGLSRCLNLKELKHVYFCVKIPVFAFTKRSLIAFTVI